MTKRPLDKDKLVDRDINDSPFFAAFDDMLAPPDSNTGRALVNKLQSRRVDDSLLNLLSEVLACNSEYSKSVAVLLESESIKAENLEEVQDELLKLRELTEQLVASEEKLLERISSVSEEYKDFINEALKELQEEQQDYLTKKFSALFSKMGLKEDGSEHAPTDKFIVAIKNMLNHHVLSTAAMFILYHLAVYLIKAKF